MGVGVGSAAQKAGLITVVASSSGSHPSVLEIHESMAAQCGGQKRRRWWG